VVQCVSHICRDLKRDKARQYEREWDGEKRERLRRQHKKVGESKKGGGRMRDRERD